MSMIIATLHVANIRIGRQEMVDFIEDVDMHIAPMPITRIPACMDCGIEDKWAGLDICRDCFDRRNACDWD